MSADNTPIVLPFEYEMFTWKDREAPVCRHQDECGSILEFPEINWGKATMRKRKEGATK